MVIVNRLLALVVGAAVAAGGLLVIIEAIWAWTGSGFVWIPGQEWLTSFKTTTWSDNLPIAISIGVAVIGFILVLAELRPRRPRVAPFESDRDTWLLLRRSTEGYLNRRLERAVPTSPIRTRINPRGPWRVRVTARAAASTRPALDAAVKAELERLHAPRARVRIRTTGKGAGA